MLRLRRIPLAILAQTMSWNFELSCAASPEIPTVERSSLQ